MKQQSVGNDGEERALMHTIRKRQRTLRGDLLLRMVIEGKMEGKRTSERPRQMMLNLMMTYGYGKLKKGPSSKRSGDVAHLSLPKREKSRKRLLKVACTALIVGD